MELRKILLITILFISFIVLHESTHYAIGLSYGCNPEFHIGKIGLYVSYGAENCYYPQDVMRLNAWNEIIGYNIMPMILIYLSIKILKD